MSGIARMVSPYLDNEVLQRSEGTAHQAKEKPSTVVHPLLPIHGFAFPVFIYPWSSFNHGLGILGGKCQK
jgi:hypothetical protein